MTDSTLDTAASSSVSGGDILGVTLFYLVVLVVAIVAYWKIFAKAGQAGWKSLIPIYNLYVLIKIAGRPGWWLLLALLPFVNILILLLLSLDLAKSFGKSPVFGVVGLFLFTFIGMLILAFGKATYVGPGGNPSGTDGASNSVPPVMPAGPAAPAA